MSPIEAKVLGLLRERGPLCGREIVVLLPEHREDHVRAVLWAMVQSLAVEITPDIRFRIPSRPGWYG